jgi:cell division protein ZapA (FtsZ GTPase activity inhibitor)
MQKSIRIEVLGHTYPLRVAAEDEAFTQRVAAFVDERFRAVRSEVTGVSDLTHAVLGALGIAEELVIAREELERLQRRVHADADALAGQLDAALAPGGDGAASTNP